MRPITMEMHAMNFTTPNQRIGAIKGLTNLAFDHPQLENELLDLIRKVVGPAPVVHVATSLEPTASELILAKNNSKIPAIKSYRERTGVGLKEAKEAIEKAGCRLGFYSWDLASGSYTNVS